MTDLNDSRDRPVVFETKAESGPRRPRLRVRVFATVAGAAAVLVAATGIAWGGSALWSVVGTTTEGDAPAPLWFTTPPQITAPSSEDRRTNDVRDDPPGTRSPSSTVDDRRGVVTAPGTATRQQEPEPGDDRRGRGRSGGSSGRG